MANVIVAAEEYRDIDGQLHEIKRQLRQEKGYPFNPKQLTRVLQAVIEGRFEAVGGQFPCQIYAADIIPGEWRVVEDVAPTITSIADLEFVSHLKGGESYVSGEKMCRRAVELKANYGLSDAKFFLDHQEAIPEEIRGKFIVFTGTKSRSPGGGLSVACLYWDGDRWIQYWPWLDDYFGADCVLPRGK